MTIKIRIPEFEDYIQTVGINKRRPWTEQEEEILMEYYGVIPTALIAKHLDRTIKSIQDKATAMGISAVENQKRRASSQDHKK